MAEAERQKNESNEQDPDLLCELQEPGYHLCLRLANQQMECRVDYFPQQPEAEIPEAVVTEPAGGEVASEVASEETINPEPFTEDTVDASPIPPPVTPAELIQLLHRYNIRQGIDFEALYNVCAAAEAGLEQCAVLIATGTAPQIGADGWFELVVKTSGDKAEFVEDEHGKVDLRTRHAFTEIRAGQKIGTLHPPQEGIPGITVHGLPIPAERGRIYSLVAGEGVELKYEGRVAFAVKDGRALLERQVLSVVDQLVVSDDLDLKVGNIDFNGFVEVKGDVLDEFHIKASKGIKVGGVVGACRLESEGSIDIGSMAGKESGEIICRGDLISGFLNQVKVFCYGDVLVTNEIRSSLVKATGRVIVERGSIIGGTCVALEGIEAKILGATSGLPTFLTAGVYFPDEDRFTFLRDRLRTVETQIKRLKAAIGPLTRLCDLDETTGKRLAILTDQWEKLEVEKEQLSAEMAASTRQEQETCNPKINAGSKLMEGVQITLGNATHKYKIERQGPLSIIENTKRGGFYYLGMTPLSKPATELEKEALAEEKRMLEAAEKTAE